MDGARLYQIQEAIAVNAPDPEYPDNPDVTIPLGSVGDYESLTVGELREIVAMAVEHIGCEDQRKRSWEALKLALAELAARTSPLTNPWPAPR